MNFTTTANNSASEVDEQDEPEVNDNEEKKNTADKDYRLPKNISYEKSYCKMNVLCNLYT